MEKMEFKEDFKEAKERIMAWWDHEIIDRPAMDIICLVQIALMQECGIIGRVLKIGMQLRNISTILKKKPKPYNFGAECFPRFFPNYGPGIMAAVFGIKPLFKSKTVWFNQPTRIDEN
jgi:hypothetical protein